MPKKVLIGRHAGKGVFLDPKERSTHLQIMGSSGMGKSKLAEFMIRQDIKAGHGVCLIDPHGSLYDAVVEWCAYYNLDQHRTIHLINPSAGYWSVAFNPLWVREGEDIARTVDRVVDALAKVWGGEDRDKTPRLTKVLAAVCHVLAARRLSLMEASNLLSIANNDGLRTALSADLADGEYRRLWDDFNSLKPTELAQWFESSDSRFMRFITSPTIKAMLGQVEAPIDLQKCMDNDEIVLINLRESNRLSIQNASVIGALIFNELLSLASNRTDEEFAKQHPFYLYIDECYRYINSDIEDMLNQTRKRGLHVSLIHHYFEQLRSQGEAIYRGVKTNAQTKIIFGGIEDEDAEILARDLFRTEFDLNQPKEVLNKPVPTGRFYKETLSAWSTTDGSADGEGDSSVDSLMDGTGTVQFYDADGIALGGYSGSQTSGAGRADSRSRSHVDTHATTESEHEVLVPEYAIMPTAVKGIEEVTHEAIARLRGLTEQFAIIKKPGERTVYIKIPFVERQGVIPKYLEDWVNQLVKKNEHSMHREDAVRVVEQRRLLLIDDARQAQVPAIPAHDPDDDADFLEVVPIEQR